MADYQTLPKIVERPTLTRRKRPKRRTTRLDELDARNSQRAGAPGGGASGVDAEDLRRERMADGLYGQLATAAIARGGEVDFGKLRQASRIGMDDDTGGAKAGPKMVHVSGVGRVTEREARPYLRAQLHQQRQAKAGKLPRGITGERSFIEHTTPDGQVHRFEGQWNAPKTQDELQDLARVRAIEDMDGNRMRNEAHAADQAATARHQLARAQSGLEVREPLADPLAGLDPIRLRQLGELTADAGYDPSAVLSPAPATSTALSPIQQQRIRSMIAGKQAVGGRPLREFPQDPAAPLSPEAVREEGDRLWRERMREQIGGLPSGTDVQRGYVPAGWDPTMTREAVTGAFETLQGPGARTGAEIDARRDASGTMRRFFDGPSTVAAVSIPGSEGLRAYPLSITPQQARAQETQRTAALGDPNAFYDPQREAMLARMLEDGGIGGAGAGSSPGAGGLKYSVPLSPADQAAKHQQDILEASKRMNAAKIAAQPIISKYAGYAATHFGDPSVGFWDGQNEIGGKMDKVVSFKSDVMRELDAIPDGTTRAMAAEGILQKLGPLLAYGSGEPEGGMAGEYQKQIQFLRNALESRAVIPTEDAQYMQITDDKE